MTDFTMHIQKVNLNRASFEEIAKLPEVGEIRAKEIIDHRPYHSWDDLRRKVPSFTSRDFNLLKSGYAEVN
ncbi:MAG: ComEA family DNA-binding protein [Chitinispirillaceae bacterium]